MNTMRNALAGLLLAVLAAPAAAQAPARATWQEHEFDFTYMGFTTQYSCDGLRHKVRAVLEALGARARPEIRATGCEVGGGVALSPRVHVKVALPVPAADGADGAFAAEETTVTLAPSTLGTLAAGDCELVEQLREKVLPALGTEVLAERTGCVPHQLGLGRPLLQARVLRPVAAD